MSELAEVVREVGQVFPWILGSVLITTIIVTVVNARSRSTTKDMYADHRKILESQIELIVDPREDPGGLALRSNRDNVELLSLSAKDGELYRRNYISVYDDEIEAVADYLSVEACERKQETGGLHDE